MKTKLLITGKSSMIGSAIIKIIDTEKYEILAPSTEQLNLLYLEQTQSYFKNYLPDMVIHLAGKNGGIEYNRLFPATIAWETVQMAQNILRCAADYGVKKCLSVLASCSYPDQGELELEECTLHTGKPNKSVACHGYAKRWLDILSQQFSKESQLQAVNVILTNSFGEGDRFDSLRSKVVSGMIKKFIIAKLENKEHIECYGDGKPLRELIYCKDAAKLILLALEKHNDIELPINIGTPFETSILELANTIRNACQYNGQIIWDTSKTNGQMRKKLSLTRMNSILLDNQKFNYTPFKEAILSTVQWYMENPTWAK